MPFARVLLILYLSLTLNAAEWSLETLYTRPFVWGTSPQNLQWAKAKPILGFLWNAEGRRFLDLYVWNAETQKRIRLTELEFAKDEFNPLPDENDERLKAHRMPDAGLSGFTLSDDGSRAAFAFRGDIYLAPSDGSAKPLRLTQTRAVENDPQFSPDGRRISFVRGGEIFVTDLHTGAVIQLNESAAGNATYYRWSPDGEHLLYLTAGPGTRIQTLTNYSGRFATVRPFPRSVAGDEPPPPNAFVIASRGGKPVKLAESALGAKASVSGLQWSPDSHTILSKFITFDRKRRLLAIHDPKTGKCRTLFEDKDDRWIGQGFEMWSPDSKTVAFTADHSGFIHLHRVPAAGAKPEVITSGNWELDTERFGFDPQWVGARLYYSSTEAGSNERQFYSVLPDGSGKQRLSRREGINVGAISEDGKYLALLEADLKNPFDLYVNEVRVTESPRKEFSTYQWPETRFIEFPSRTDRQIVKAKLLLPPGYTPEAKAGKKWPCVFFIHGAGIASSVLKQWGSYQDLRFVFNTYLANKGYVVMDLDYRGSSGYGREWRTGVYLHMGGQDLEDVLGAVDYLKGLGNVDMDKLGIWGVSYGGFMTNMALFRSPGTFKAGSAWAAVNDWENYNAGYTRERLTTPAENPEAYRRSSPITFSHNLKDNLLIIHGMVDSNVLFQDAVQLTEKLIQEGKHFDEMFYPQEDHGFVRDETLMDAFRRTAEYFERYLK